MTTEQLNAADIVERFRTWSIEDQLALIRSLVEAMLASERRARARLSVYDLAGIARPESGDVSDEQIEAWLDERRMKESV